MITKGEKTVVTTHEDKRHTYQEGDYVELKEVEGMTQINAPAGPFKITATTKHTFTLDLDSSSFGDYVRQGVVENKKVAKPLEFHSWDKSFKNPAGSSQYGMLETPDLAKFGRSEQLHAALYGIVAFTKAEGRYPETADVKKCMELAQAEMKANVAQDEGNMTLESIEEDVFTKAVSYSASSISPMAAFFGGIVAQEIVKYTGKYTPLKQWLHFDIYETLPREAVNRAPLGGRYDDQIKIYGQEL
jgi:ubiquitin-activating enzyme E1